MAHIQQFQFFEVLSRLYPRYFNGGCVAEIGSLDINGSIRQFFQSDEYIGYDLQLGNGVDRAEQGQLISSPTGYFDAAISAECFEHNPYWVETFSNMLRITKASGAVIFSCASTGRQEHGTSRTSTADSPLTSSIGWNYYKNLDANDFIETFNMAGWFDGFHFLFCPQTYDLYFFGIRSNGDASFNSQDFVRLSLEVERGLWALNNSVRILFWTKDTGLVPR
jgi:SAM-dependent methyltransferase